MKDVFNKDYNKGYLDGYSDGFDEGYDEGFAHGIKHIKKLYTEKSGDNVVLKDVIERWKRNQMKDF